MIKDLGNGKKSKAIMYTSQLFASTVEIPSLSNQPLIALQSSKEILKGAILELKEKPYEYNFKNMEINLFSKENESEKIKLMNTVLIVVYVILRY